MGLQKLPEQAESNKVWICILHSLSLKKKHVSNNLFSLYFIKESVWGGLDMNS